MNKENELKRLEIVMARLYDFASCTIETDLGYTYCLNLLMKTYYEFVSYKETYEREYLKDYEYFYCDINEIETLLRNYNLIDNDNSKGGR